MAKKKSPDNVQVIDLTGTVDKSAANKENSLSGVRKRLPGHTPAAKRVKTEGDTSKRSAAAAPKQDDDEVQVLDEEEVKRLSYEPAAASSSDRTAASSDDIELVGTKNQVLLPHMRPHCTSKPFQGNAGFSAAAQSAVNTECCALCFCYVCDIPAAECKAWGSHCHATDQGPTAQFWSTQRQASRRNKQRAAATLAPSTATVQAQPRGTLHDFFNPRQRGQAAGAQNHQATTSEEELARREFAYKPGPFAPDHQLAAQDKALVKCRKCSWFNRFKHRYHETGDRQGAEFVKDWCHACGRIASERSFDPKQPRSFQPKAGAGDILLGTKVIPFTIKAHDPRQMKQFKTLWTKHEDEWVWDEREMQNDMFRHRLGGRPSLDEVLFAVSNVKSSKIPVDGTWDHIATSTHYPGCVSNTQAILLDNPSDHCILQELLSNAGSFGETVRSADIPVCNALAGDIRADWDRDSRKGTITIQVYSLDGSYTPSSVTRFLGTWFGISPFPLSEVNGTLKPKTADAASASEAKRAEKAAKQRKKGLALDPGGPSKLLGGVCGNETGFAGIMKRYFREILVDVVHQSHIMTKPIPESYLSKKDGVVAVQGFRKHANVVYSRTKTLNGLLGHLENLGHAAAPHIEGLTVELLPFQSQSVQWATEREQQPGGIQSFFVTKLPAGMQRTEDLYYNFVTGRMSRQKPHLVRGGLICSEMGLGKTVISLALILQNPAPALPESGTLAPTVNSLTALASGKAFWDPDLYGRTSSTKEKRGSILSRGTLVVCNVSLVGQWIEEAKSKLKDPGLVYSYHGAGRKRDPNLLAQNSIVVTTYETLASDASYHAKKSADEVDYTAPCEQVRWWRIICDESHVLRNGGTKKAKAVMDLVGDNKWLVSGTPVNTSIMDLQNQLKFVGIQDVTRMFELFIDSTGRHVSDGQQKSRRWMNVSPLSPLGHFTFLMRAVLMRHSQKQKYRNTSTSLMSLPPKTERTIVVKATPEDEAEYQDLESTALDFYTQFKLDNQGDLNRHYLKISQKLTPLRIACSGGHVPSADSGVGTGTNADDDEDEEAEVVATKKGKKEKQFSKFAFKSKLNTLVGELERIRTADPTAKSLVFSQFTSTLKWMQQELPKHGFQFRTLSGDMTMKKRAKALADFQNDPPTTIFLLSMRAGAVGINLTQANRVFIMEPCFNPALEAQAVGRVHRLGQTRAVEITRLIMKDSVESRMVQMLEKKYGKAGAAEDATAANADDGDKKPAAVKVRPVMVGSLKSDRTVVLQDEFDLLFGVEESLPNGNDPEMVTSATL